VSDDQQPATRPLGALSPRAWWWTAGLILIATAVLGIVLWWMATRGLSGPALVTARFDAVKIALSVGAGSGGAVALYLTWRRQHSAEQVALDNRHDGEQRRVTELYAKAAEMLGAERAAVRMAGLYALERLAQDHPGQRKPVVNVLCAYLRMPFLDPDEPQPTVGGWDAGAETITAHERRERRQEVEVRYAVQGLLRRHVHCVPAEGDPVNQEYWGDDLSVYLGAATLMNFNLNGCRVHPGTRFSGATFIGNHQFVGATFTGPVWFSRVTFTGSAIFDDAEFTSTARFDDATFMKEASFTNAMATITDGHRVGH
jgi:hypothetical protein